MPTACMTPIKRPPRTARASCALPAIGPRPWEGNPGWFTAAMRLHNWPPGFIPLDVADPGEQRRREAAVRGRATQLARGHTGSIKHGLSRKSAGVVQDVKKAAVE